MKYLTLLHSNNGFVKSPQCNVIRILPVLLVKIIVKSGVWELKALDRQVATVLIFHILVFRFITACRASVPWAEVLASFDVVVCHKAEDHNHSVQLSSIPFLFIYILTQQSNGPLQNQH